MHLIYSKWCPRIIGYISTVRPTNTERVMHSDHHETCCPAPWDTRPQKTRPSDLHWRRMRATVQWGLIGFGAADCGRGGASRSPIRAPSEPTGTDSSCVGKLDPKTDAFDVLQRFARTEFKNQEVRFRIYQKKPPPPPRRLTKLRWLTRTGELLVTFIFHVVD